MNGLTGLSAAEIAKRVRSRAVSAEEVARAHLARARLVEPVIDAFLREVAASGLRVTLRRSRGSDIQAACGQLALRGAA